MNLAILIKKSISNPSKIPLAIKIELKSLGVILRYGLPDIMPQFLGGIGDELLLTTVTHELKKRSHDIRVWQVSPAAELLRHNPDYTHVFDMNYWYLRYSNLLNKQRLTLRYSEMPIQCEKEIYPKEHILARLCSAANITGEIEIRPYYFINTDEAKDGRLFAKQICIQSIGHRTHESWMQNKLWFHDRFQQVVDSLITIYPDIKIIQIGVAKDISLQRVLDLRGKTSLRETAAILSQSICFIGTEGFLPHLARAVHCRSVVIFGGRAHSSQMGYICNENLESFIDCSPCWQWNVCHNNRRCMGLIQPKDVIQAVARVLDRANEPLEVEQVQI